MLIALELNFDHLCCRLLCYWDLHCRMVPRMVRCTWTSMTGDQKASILNAQPLANMTTLSSEGIANTIIFFGKWDSVLPNVGDVPHLLPMGTTDHFGALPYFVTDVHAFAFVTCTFQQGFPTSWFTFILISDIHQCMLCIYMQSWNRLLKPWRDARK